MLYTYVSAIIIIACMAVSGLINKKSDNKTKYIKIMFYTYVAAVLYLTLLSREPTDDPVVKLKVYHWWKLETSYQNILLFIPLGFLLPQAVSFIRKRTWLIPLITVVISYTIEYLQNRFAIGWFDVNDIICNFIGGYIGLFIYELFTKKENET